MLERSFIFLPGVGETTERRLWDQGVDHWDAYESTPVSDLRGIGERTKSKHEPLLQDARRALHGGGSFFAEHLPSGESWRTFEAYREGAVYLDIETTGMNRWSTITVVGLMGPRGTRCLVKGEDLERGRVEELLGEARMLVTFNGASFDLPMLEAKGIDVPNVPHLDLRYPLKRLGHGGGLKRIERELGMARGSELDGLSGADAVRLWRRWERRGDRGARDTLVEYNRADVENMEHLARYTYDAMRKRVLDTR